MGQSIEVTQEMFQTEVLEPSFNQPVLVDFFATWCGPCQLLKPMLEKLATEYDFILAKIDIDQNTELANAYQVEGVPDVRIVQDGEVLKGFVGVLPEPQIRELLANLGLQSTLDQSLAGVKQAIAEGNLDRAQHTLNALLAELPDNPELQLTAAELSIQQQQYDQARTQLAALSPHDRTYGSRVQGLQGLLELHQTLSTLTVETPLDQIFLTAHQAAVAGDYEAALNDFLTVIEKDRRYRNDGARKVMLTLFSLLGDDHPLTKTYRKRLMQALY